MQVISYSQLTITPSYMQGGCSGFCGGTAGFSVTGGSAPYTYTYTPNTGLNSGTNSSGLWVQNLCAGVYTLSVTDQNLSTSSYTFSTIQSPSITAVFTTTNSNCSAPCGGAIDIAASGGIPPISYNYFYGSNPFPVTLPMNNVCQGIHKFYLCDSNGCCDIFNVPLQANTTLSSVTANLNATNSSCINSFDGSINLNLSGSNPGPFTYSWSPNNQTTQNITGGPGVYMVTIYDASMNCLTLSDTINPITGYCGTISGNIFIDNNSDCIKNSGDVNCISAGVTANPGNRVGYTNSLGNYYINNLPYGTYTITPSNYANSVIGTCVTTLIVTSPSIFNNFPAGYTSLTQPDVQVSAFTNGIVPGFNCYVNYSLCNLNNVSATGLYKAILPSGFVSNITSVTPTTYTISGDTVIWNYSNITSSGGCLNFTINFTTPISTPLGSLFTTCVSAINSTADFEITNNYFCYDRIVTGAFDPNDKSVSPVGVGPNGNITTNDSILTYLIRFQNTGNGPAQTVIVTDSISSFLDPTTFQMLGTSHNYNNIEITSANIIKWTFNNIMLPDSNTNEPASHGYIRYKIKQKANNPIGTKIKNTAYIYFDFNDPVITNTTLNTIDIAASINENKNVLVFFIYPNPTSGSVLINSQTNFNFVEVLSITGQTLLSEKVNSKTHQLQLQNFSEGIYFVKVSYADGRSLTKKVIKQ
jgi:uncharacterized repeat protein (TIGR01451 family)